MTVELLFGSGSVVPSEACQLAEIVGPATKDASPGETVEFACRATLVNADWFYVAHKTYPKAEVTVEQTGATLDISVRFTVPRNSTADYLNVSLTVYVSKNGGGDDPTPENPLGRIDLVASADPPGFGTVTPTRVAKQGVTPPQTFSANLAATPKPGYEFIHWSLNGRTLEDKPASFTYTCGFPGNGVTDNLNFVASFRPKKVPVTLLTRPNDANKGSTAPAAQTVEFDFGTLAVLRAAAIPLRDVNGRAYSFDGWYLEGGSSPKLLTRNSSLAYEYKVVTEQGHSASALAVFGNPKTNPSPPPGWDGPTPYEDPYDSRPYVRVNTFVAPDGCPAEAFPPTQVKTGEPGTSVQFTVMVEHTTVVDAAGATWKFVCWQDGDGNVVSEEPKFGGITVTVPQSGEVTLGYTAVYSMAAPKTVYKAMTVTLAGRYLTTQFPVAECGRGSVLQGGGAIIALPAKHGERTQQQVVIRSYVVAETSGGTPTEVHPLQFPTLTAEIPNDDRCVFRRWVARAAQSDPSVLSDWKTVTESAVLEHADLAAQFPEIDDVDRWFNTEDQARMYPAVEVVPVFEIKRAILVESGATLYRTDNRPEVVTSLEELAIADFFGSAWLEPGESVFFPFRTNLASDPPAGYIHHRYLAALNKGGDAIFDGDFFSTLHYSGIMLHAPDDTTDFTFTDSRGRDCRAPSDFDAENGISIGNVTLIYAIETGLPIHDEDGDIIANKAGAILADVGHCGL